VIEEQNLNALEATSVMRVIEEKLLLDTVVKVADALHPEANAPLPPEIGEPASN